MNLTVEQALQQGVAAHKEGKLQDAERLYRAILESQPEHPDANHNLGVLAVSVNKANEALALFKTALDANPQVEQFWLSYINALIRVDQPYEAQRVLEQAVKQGVDEGRLGPLKAELAPKPPNSHALRGSPSQELLNRLIQHHKSGRFSEAEKLAAKLTQDFPRHQSAWKVLGAIFEATGRKSEAVDTFQTAVELAPRDAEARGSLGNTLQQLGRLDEAVERYREAIALKPDFAEAYSNLGVALKVKGRLEEAKDSYAQAIALKPNYAEAHYNLGNTLKKLGKLEDAEASYNQAIALEPGYALAHNNLGVALKELGRLEEAEASYNRAIALKENYAEAHNNLGNTLHEQGRHDEALAAYGQAIVMQADYALAHNNLGGTLKELGRLDEAVESYSRAIEFKNDFAEAYSNLGNTLQEIGRLDEAEKNYNRAIALKPDYAEAHLYLCEFLEKANRVDELLAFVRTYCIKIGQKEADFLYFEALAEFRAGNYEIALHLIEKMKIDDLAVGRLPSAIKLKGDIFAQMRQYTAAFEAYQTANKHARNSREFQKHEPEKFFLTQKDKVSQLARLQKQSIYQPAREPSCVQPIFLIGFPRSGTTLLDTILRTHSKIDVLEELPMVQKMEAIFQDISSIAEIESIDDKTAEIARGRYFAELERHTKISDNSVLVDKLPLNILQLPLINRIFPNAKYICALRHPLDCILSCWIQDFKLNSAMANMVELERIVEFYDVTMSILRLSEDRYSLYTHRIRYEHLVLDMEKEITDLLSFLNLNWEDELKNFQKTALARDRINTPSSAQVIKPIYRSSSYRWKNYESNLGRYKARLASWIKEYGYRS
jgi:tetratricopeptide (TPR) repeat protein